MQYARTQACNTPVHGMCNMPVQGIIPAMSDKPSALASLVYGFCGFIVLLLAVQWILPERVPTLEPPEPQAECKGEPIFVDFAYNGGVNEPWTCRVQCDDQKQRYVVYTNGTATQCEDLPGCNDWGEDNGVTCTAPMANQTEASS